MPPIDPAQDMLAATAAPADVRDLIIGACYDCHSFATQYPWYVHVTPVNFIMQKLEEGQPIRFREMSAEMNAKMTGESAKDIGHTIESKCLRSVQRMTLGELHRQVLAGEISDVKAQSCGFASAFDLWEKANDAMLSHESPNPSREEVYLLEFERVDRRTWAYFNPPELPKAAFSFGGVPVSPSAYRWGANSANDNQVMAPSRRRGRQTKQLRLG